MQPFAGAGELAADTSSTSSQAWKHLSHYQVMLSPPLTVQFHSYYLAITANQEGSWN